MADTMTLVKLDNIEDHQFQKPTKRIHDGPDVSFFLTSFAYRDIIVFILQLNHAVLPRKREVDGSTKITTYPLESPDVTFSFAVQSLRALLTKLIDLVDEIPPDTGPRRFGNVSFRKWYQAVEEQLQDILAEYLPEELEPAFEELGAYLMGSFGSAQRLDYGTGHELSFIAFLACLWKVNFFPQAEPGVEERGIVLGVFELYLSLIRKIIKLYTLEPAGSHGVWGLDDNSFLPYVFGSAQFSPAITAETDQTPTEGSLPDAPEASSVAKANLVEKEKDRNMYFSAIAFIYDVKRGPFWEHSPMLFDISGIKDGWGKINKGMLKMYNAEVLSKFPVVQHFPFGSLFKWEKDPDAKPPPPSTHASSQPLRNPTDTHAPSIGRPGGIPPPPTGGTGVGATTAAPWAKTNSQPPLGFVNGVTQAPWASRTPAPPMGRPTGARTVAQRRPMPPLSESMRNQGDDAKSDETKK